MPILRRTVRTSRYLHGAISLATFSMAPAATFFSRLRVSKTVGLLLYSPSRANELSRESRAQAAKAGCAARALSPASSAM